MIRGGDIIKHPKFMDVAFIVYKSHGPYGPNKIMEITGEWMNQGFLKSWNLGVPQKLKLTFEQLNEWQICLEPTLPCIRYAKWK